MDGDPRFNDLFDNNNDDDIGFNYNNNDDSNWNNFDDSNLNDFDIDDYLNAQLQAPARRAPDEIPIEFNLPDNNNIQYGDIKQQDRNNRYIEDEYPDLDSLVITNNDNKYNNNIQYGEYDRQTLLNNMSNRRVNELADQIEYNIYEKRTELMSNHEYKKAYKLFKLKVGKKKNMVGPDEYKYDDNGDIDETKPIFDRLSNLELKEYKRKHNKKEQKRRLQDDDTRPVSRTNFSFSQGRWKYFKYQNRHLVVPQDVDYDSYYKIDSRAKNKADRETWVKILSPKWATNYHRYVWKCQELVSNKILFTTYIDGTSQMSSEDPLVQEWFRNKYTRPSLCLTIPQQQILIKKLKQMIQLFEQPRKIGYRGEREHGDDDNDGNRLNIRENGLNRARGFGEEDFQNAENFRERKRQIQTNNNNQVLNLSANMNSDADEDEILVSPRHNISDNNKNNKKKDKRSCPRQKN
jgi:hypothetical protein